MDISRDDFIEEYEIILSELKNFDPSLLSRPMLVVLAKADVLGPELVEEQIKLFNQKYPDVETMTASAVAHMGLKPLVTKLKVLLMKTKLFLSKRLLIDNMSCMNLRFKSAFDSCRED